MGVTKSHKIIGLGAMDVTKPYTLIGFGAMGVTNHIQLYGLVTPIAPKPAILSRDQQTGMGR